MAGARLIGANTLDAVRSIMTCAPDYLVMGMSAVTFFDGVSGADRFQRSIEDMSGVGVTIGSHAVAAALKAYGNVKKVSFFSPYFPTANDQVRRYLAEIGFEVVRDIALQCPTWTSIAEVLDTPTARRVLIDLDSDDVDAIIQVGTNLSLTRTAAAAELWLGKPVIAINTATYWHALRQSGINDKIFGFGRLLEEF